MTDASPALVGSASAAGTVADPGVASTGGRPAPPPSLHLADRDALDALLYPGVGRGEAVLGRLVHRTGRRSWSVGYGPELSLLAAADALMKAAGFRPC
jgi:hypothetical protein